MPFGILPLSSGGRSSSLIQKGFLIIRDIIKAAPIALRAGVKREGLNCDMPAKSPAAIAMDSVGADKPPIPLKDASEIAVASSANLAKTVLSLSPRWYQGLYYHFVFL